ncbi:MAG: hypothetical protein RIQ53_587 [Pseudomonadota bacterium]|jgi:pyruvate kinase
MSLQALAHDLDTLRHTVRAAVDRTLADWQPWLQGSDYGPSAANLAAWLALRRQDLRPLQPRLRQAGLSSLGRCEAHVLPTLDAVQALLHAALGGTALPAADAAAFDAGAQRVADAASGLFGAPGTDSPVRLMVTLPTEAATSPDFIPRLAALGVQAVRINTAHDDEAAWAAMVERVRAVRSASGEPLRILMDLPGPKIRTAAVREGADRLRVHVGEELALVAPDQLLQVPERLPVLSCAAPEVLRHVGIDDRVLIDDGKVSARVLACPAWGLLLKVEVAPPDKGWKLKPEKGLAFPDTDLDLPALTADDRRILRFVARHADAIEYSFVQTPEDVRVLQVALAAERPQDWQRIGLVLKVETRRAVRHLPQMVVCAASRQPTAVMIARGDLAVEIGFARTAEMQEEILWLCEAAQVPVIWATQVMESCLKNGVPSRGEMTDAAMAARAECVMLNKGPWLFEAIEMLDALFARMAGHLHKKSHLLRPLQSW